MLNNSQDRLEDAAQRIETAVQSHLRYSSSSPVISLPMELDLVRYIFTLDAPGEKMAYLQDFSASSLSSAWYYTLDRMGQGKSIRFPVRLEASCRMPGAGCQENPTTFNMNLKKNCCCKSNIFPQCFDQILPSCMN